MVTLTPASEQRRDEFFRLMKRVIKLGGLLPRRGDFDPEHAEEYELVIREMNATRAAMDKVLADERRARA